MVTRRWFSFERTQMSHTFKVWDIFCTLKLTIHRHSRSILVSVVLINIHCLVFAQDKITGSVYDAKTKQVLPFVTIKFGDSGQGMVADLDGKFVILPEIIAKNIKYIQVSSLGYQSK